MSRAVEQHRVAVLHDVVRPDSPLDEQDNLLQAREVAASLRRLGCRVSSVPFGRDPGAAVEKLRASRAELVFNLVESIDGNGLLQYAATAVLEALGLPFTGAGTAGLLCTSDKRLAKRLFASAGIPTPEHALSAAGIARWPRGSTAIVKPACEDASVAIDAGSVVTGPARIAAELEARRRRFGGEWFAERFVEGRELNVSLLRDTRGYEVLPIAEIEFVDFPAGRPRIVDFEAKWQSGSFGFTHTPRRFPTGREDGALLEEVRRIALACAGLFELGAYARVDLRVDGGGRPWVLEVNANPCLSSDAGFVAAAAQAGLDFDGIVQRIVAASGTHLVPRASPPRRARAGRERRRHAPAEFRPSA